ncbi:MAG: DUF262 domain-containing protein [Nitrososphaerales archaeon]
MAKQRKLNFITEEKREEADLQIRDKQSEVKYDLRDFTVDHIIANFREGLFYIPEYQREHVWNEEKQSRFVESVILGLPIPMMFLADMEDGRLEIVDGVQRISTLEAFNSDDLKLDDLERLVILNGFSFNTLPIAQQRKFRTRALRLVVLEESTTFQTRQDIFNRVNTSGEKARPSEIRRGAYQGPFMKFLEERAKDNIFRQICPISESLIKRREPLELVVRFFAYSDHYRDFRHDVTKFLDNFVIKHQNDFDKNRYKNEFDLTMEFIRKYFPNGFGKTRGAKSTPRVRFEALAVGVNLALREKPDLAPGGLKWLESPEFDKQTTTHASNSQPRIRGRIEYVRDKLLGKGE